MNKILLFVYIYAFSICIVVTGVITSEYIITRNENFTYLACGNTYGEGWSELIIMGIAVIVSLIGLVHITLKGVIK
jgi:hypothetical protein